jgi:hypothetical protein
MDSMLRPTTLPPIGAMLLTLGACAGPRPPNVDDVGRYLVEGLSFEDYKRDIRTLAGFGDRRQGSESFDRAANWIEARLRGAGYDVEYHEYTYPPGSASNRRNIYVTKVGASGPDSMYIVSAHLDGMGGGGAADDDASGVALVLEASLALASQDIRTQRSVRFIFWNNEETNSGGSGAYVRDRSVLQGIEDPPGSGRYPEPRWLGMIQHDMLLFDHGLAPGERQSPDADIDIEYEAASKRAAESEALAEALLQGNEAYSSDYPAEIGPDMCCTDSESFQAHTAAISVRENQRLGEIERGSNPHHHARTDVYETYSEADFKLGFNALQMTVGAIARLSDASTTSARE